VKHRLENPGVVPLELIEVRRAAISARTCTAAADVYGNRAMPSAPLRAGVAHLNLRRQEARPAQYVG